MVAVDSSGAAAPPPASGGTPAGGRELVGCTSNPAGVVTSGAGGRRLVALTFDDGPSETQTPEVLADLERLHAHATFFEEGRHVHGREALMGEILEAGDEIGNHSYDHPRFPGYEELLRTNRLIRQATGFTPCLFRPPYGLVDGRDASAAARLGLETVLWTVDSNDDKHPGVGAIRSRVISSASPGALVLMHDGGHHPQTVRALAGIIRGLRARGYGFATVSELLGGHFIYRE